MDMVFVYEDKIAQDVEGNYYTGSALPQSVFDRYLQHFDRLTVLMRRADVDPHDAETLSRMNRLDMERMDVVLIPDLNAGVKSHFDPRVRTLFKKTILDLIHPGTAVIVRVPSVSGTIAADYCHKKGIPYLVEAVGCPWDSLWNHSIKGKIMAPVWWKRMRRTLRNADYSVYVTNEFLQRRYPSNGVSVAISDVELQPMNEAVLESRLGKIKNHTGKIKLGTAGALHVAYKGQQYVIEALAVLKKEGRDNFEYHLVGGGNNSAILTAAKQLGVYDQVFFDGLLPHDEMFKWLNNLDVYIQPSTVESMPRALLEAMSIGLPCLGSTVGDIPYLLKDNAFPKGDVGRIVEKLQRIDERWLTNAAVRDFAVSKRFVKTKLDSERFQIYKQFSEIVKDRA